MAHTVKSVELERMPLNKSGVNFNSRRKMGLFLSLWLIASAVYTTIQSGVYINQTYFISGSKK
jgi:hypothetical protein